MLTQVAKVRMSHSGHFLSCEMLVIIKSKMDYLNCLFLQL